MSRSISSWRVIAQNLPEHANNPIHTDAGATAAGFPAALVAGVTTYAYLTHPIVDAWGEAWLANGGGELLLLAPVFDQREVLCRLTEASNGHGEVAVEAVDSTEDRNPRALLRAVRDSGPPPQLRDGEALQTHTFAIPEYYPADTAQRIGDDLAIYANAGVAHPGTWPHLANMVFQSDLVKGSWIHTRSIIRHHAVVPNDATVIMRGSVVQRFQKGGQRAIVDFAIEHEGTVAVTIEHEAIIDLTSSEAVSPAAGSCAHRGSAG